MKITVIGGGSTYTPELVNGFLSLADRLGLKDLWLMDIDAARLAVVGGFAQRMAAANGRPFKVHLSADRAEAIAGSSYVITQLRVGQMPARRGDEYLGQRHGLIGQETTGIGGMAKALRTIPVILQIAEEIRRSAPGALLLNFTNPAGLVTEALQRYAPKVASVGVCNVGITTKMHLIEAAEKLQGRKIDPQKAVLNTLGLNHLTWHRGFKVDGEELWPRLFNAYLEEQRTAEHPEWDLHLLETLQMLPNYYLSYFYETEKKRKEQDAWPPSRAETVMEVEMDLLKEYADPALTAPPADLMKRGGAYYSTLATQLIDAHHNNLGQVHIVNTRHGGAAAGWPADWVLELPCRVNRKGVHPLPTPVLPLVCSGLVAQVKMFELLTVEAAVQGDRKAAYQALLAHPLGPSSSEVQTVLNDMLETNRAWLPQFFGPGSVKVAPTGGFYLGIDAGGTKTHALLADESGQAIALAEGGPGNHQTVGYDGTRLALAEVTRRVLEQAGIERTQIKGAGFGLAGYDWPSQLAEHDTAVTALGLDCPYEIVNDAVIGLLAGAEQGWGVVLVAGTGNNCRGRDRAGREGRITGEGVAFGEYGGGGELVFTAVQAVSAMWSQRGPATVLAGKFLALTGAKDLSDLIEGLDLGRYQADADWARVVAAAALEGDKVAKQLVDQAGRELGKSAAAVIRQLGLERETFEVVLAGSLFKSGDLLIHPLKQIVQKTAPRARLVLLKAPPVVGGVVLALQKAGLETPARRTRLVSSVGELLAGEMIR